MKDDVGLVSPHFSGQRDAVCDHGEAEKTERRDGYSSTEVCVCVSEAEFLLNTECLLLQGNR